MQAWIQSSLGLQAARGWTASLSQREVQQRPTELAVRIARDRARVVDIGKTSLDLPWNEYYLKELDVRFSRSYGPGRYDPTYEERGIDYPIGYVRWTEKRNLAAFLELVSEGKVLLDPLISSVRPFAEADRFIRNSLDRREMC